MKEAKKENYYNFVAKHGGKAGSGQVYQRMAKDRENGHVTTRYKNPYQMMLYKQTLDRNNKMFATPDGFNDQTSLKYVSGIEIDAACLYFLNNYGIGAWNWNKITADKGKGCLMGCNQDQIYHMVKKYCKSNSSFI